ncbi:MAG: TRAP transporter large permease subunit [Acetobacteraceae bacterium]|nr:TRAP transporter large permease subunit [Acetobacteraceae bacterium]
MPEPVVARLAGGTFQRWLDLLLDILLAIALLGQLGVMFFTIVGRYFFGYQLLWGQEISMITLTSLAFIGGAVAYSRNKHMAVEVLSRRLPTDGRQLLAAIVDWHVMLFAVLSFYLCLPLVQSRMDMLSPIMGVPEALFMGPLPTGMVLICLVGCQRLWRRSYKHTLLAGALVLLCFAALYWAREAIGPFGMNTATLWATLIVFVVWLAIGVPIGFCLALTAMFFLFMTGQAPPKSVPQTMYGGILGYVLLTIPFFVYAGFIMTDGGLSRRLADCVIALIGRLRGGLLQVIIVAMYIVSGISGSKVADVAAVGSSVKGMLRRNGYSMNEAAAVLAASAIMGETIPPSIPMLVMGAITTVSVASMFAAGLVPAAFMAVCLMTLVFFRAKRLDFPVGIKVPPRQAVRATLTALPPLLVPIFLIAGIMGGIATPTEISSVAVVYALVLAIVFYREMDARQFWATVVETTTTGGMILFIISGASAFSWALAAANLPEKIATALLSLGGSNTIFLMGTVITLIVTGAFLEGLPALLIFAPMLMPIAVKFGINPVHYGLVLIIAMGFGTFTPPVGIGIYVTCAITETSMEDTGRALMPYLVLLFFGVLAVAFVPWFSLILPQLLHMTTR